MVGAPVFMSAGHLKSNVMNDAKVTILLDTPKINCGIWNFTMEKRLHHKKCHANCRKPYETGAMYM